MRSGSALAKVRLEPPYARGPAGPLDIAKIWQSSSYEAKVGGWTETRPVSLGLLPSGPDPVGEWCVHRQPPSLYLDHARDFRKLRELLVLDPFE